MCVPKIRIIAYQKSAWLYEHRRQFWPAHFKKENKQLCCCFVMTEAYIYMYLFFIISRVLSYTQTIKDRQMCILVFAGTYFPLCFLVTFSDVYHFFFLTVVFSFSSVRVAFEYRQNKQTKLSLSPKFAWSLCLYYAVLVFFFFFNLELS